MKFPITNGSALSVVLFGAILASGAMGFLYLVGESIRIGQDRHYQAGLRNGMIECRLKPDECDARFEAWEAEERLKEVLKADE